MNIDFDSLKEAITKKVDAELKGREAFTGSDDQFAKVMILKDASIELQMSFFLPASIQTTEDLDRCIEQGAHGVLCVLAAATR